LPQPTVKSALRSSPVLQNEQRIWIKISQDACQALEGEEEELHGRVIAFDVRKGR